MTEEQNTPDAVVLSIDPYAKEKVEMTLDFSKVNTREVRRMYDAGVTQLTVLGIPLYSSKGQPGEDMLDHTSRWIFNEIDSLEKADENEKIAEILFADVRGA